VTHAREPIGRRLRAGACFVEALLQILSRIVDNIAGLVRHLETDVLAPNGENERHRIEAPQGDVVTVGDDDGFDR
jgi:hypothetical protein